MNDNLTISIIREHMRKIGQKGGKRRAQTTTAAQRKRIARKGGKASGRARRGDDTP